jgi:peptidoglycan/xylan/chitin deacetylase (PgdA/CDA1 family)
MGIEIGAHTMTHPILKNMSDDAAFVEIEKSRAWIAEKVGDAPRLFAYPNGRRGDDYEPRHAEMVRSAGYLAGFSTNWGCATACSPLFELPRFRPWESHEAGYFSRLLKVVARSYVT